ncbi:MAG: glutathione S-transferase family protein [Pseudomonadota bacterium]
MLKLYYSPGACSLAPHIALEEARAEFEAVRLDLRAGEQLSPEYRQLNPKGRVPALVTDAGILTENPAILLYIAMRKPGANLAPLDDVFRLAQMQAFNAYLSSTVHVAHAHGPRGIRWADEASSLADMKRKVPENMASCFELIENEYLEGPWVLGEQYTVADAYLFTIASWLEADGVDVNRFPRVLAHRNAMQKRPAVQAVLARESA